MHIVTPLTVKFLLQEEQILSIQSCSPPDKRGKNVNGRVASPESVPIHLNPIALRKAKIVYNFGLSESNRVQTAFCQCIAIKNLQNGRKHLTFQIFFKMCGCTSMFLHHYYQENNFCHFCFAFLDEKTLPMLSLFLKERTCPLRSNSNMTLTFSPLSVKEAAPCENL